MTYGSPSLDSALRELEAGGVRRILVLPLYPQYSGSTTAAAHDALYRLLRTRRWLPELRTLNSYHDHPAYIAALAASVRAHWSAHGRGEHLLMSFHGVPQRYVLAGDPYYCQCHKTARLLGERLQLGAADCTVSFQSRFGKAPWVQPYTDVTVLALARRGVRRLDAICPGFAADCLETLEEVALRYRADFVAAGGEELRYIPALNASAGHVAALAEIAGEQLRGWTFAAENGEAAAVRLRRAQAHEAAFFGRG
jgi:ferrochelatase